MKMKSTYLVSTLKKAVVSLALVFVLPLTLFAQAYYEGFDQAGPYPADNLPFGWSQGKIVGASAFNTFQRQSPPTLPAATVPSAPAVLTYRSWNAPAGEAALLSSKALDLSMRGAASTNFRFSIYRSNGWAGFLDNIQVYVNTAPTLTGALLLADTTWNATAINRYWNDAPAEAAVGWYTYGYTIPAGAPYTATAIYVLIRGNSAFGENIHMDNFSISQSATAMTLTSCDMVAQNVANVGINTTNNWIIQIRAIANGAGTPYGLDSIYFNTNGSSFPCADIAPNSAKLWWMGGTPVFDVSIAYPVGVGAAVCGTNYKFIPAAGFRLDNDTNYFWITYDISAGATAGNFVDAEFLGMDLAFGAAGNTVRTPAVATMAGAREIDLAYCIPTYFVGTSWLNYNTNDYIRHVQLASHPTYVPTVPGINNALNSVGPNAGGCAGGPCSFSAHPPDYERFAPVAGANGTTAVLIANGTSNYNIYAQVGTYASGNCLAAWIDFNHDGFFDNNMWTVPGGEKIMQTAYPPGQAGSSNYPLVGNYPTYGGWEAPLPFNVAPSSYMGNTTLRVREVWISGNITPCGTYTYGECEDYTITIVPDCNVIPALIGWSIWLGGVSEDWTNPINWCGGVPLSTRNAIVLDSTTASQVYLGGAASPVAPTFWPVIKNGVVAATRKLRIEGADSITIDAPLVSGGSLNVYDSLHIRNSSKLKVMSSLIDTARISNGTLLNTNAYPFNGAACRQRMQVLFTQGDFLSRGLIANDVIDELHFWISTKGSTIPYSSFNISYYYTTPIFNFSAAMNGWAGIVGPPFAPVTIFSGPVTTPASGTKLIVPLIPNSFIWNGGTNQVVIDICWDNGSTVTFNDQTTYTQTVGLRKSAIVRVLNPPGAAPAGCSLDWNSAGNITKIGTDQRANITFKYHRNFVKYPINMRSTAGSPGHLVNDGTFGQGTSIVTFMGTPAHGMQNIDGTTQTTFHELAINNTAHVRMNTSATVEDTLWLTTGHLILNKAVPTAINTLTLNLGTPAAITRTVNGYLRSESLPPNYGRLRWQIGANTALHVIPFVTATPTSILFDYTATAGTTDLTINTYGTPANNTPWPTGVTNINNYFTNSDNSTNMVDRFWVINNAGVGPVASMTFRFAPVEAPGAGAVSSQRWDNILTWQPYTPGQSSTATSNTSPGISLFNTPWALTLNPQPLPIELVNFEAKPVGSRVKLDWVTATEVDNDYFTVERTRDTRSFEFIAEVRSQGPSTSNQYYTTFDNDPLNGLQYYRLKQTDYNKKFTYSDLVPVYFGKDAAFEIVSVVNNDDNSFTVIFRYDSSEPYSYKVIDVTGRIITSENGKQASPGTNIFDVNTNMSTGVYTIIIQNSSKVVSRKIFR